MEEEISFTQKVYSEGTEELQYVYLSRALLFQLFFPDGFYLAARTVFHAAVKTVIFVGCCFPPMTSEVSH